MGVATMKSSDLQDMWAAKRAAELARQRVTIRCGFCTTGRGFKVTAAFFEAQARFDEHVATAHPEVRLTEIRAATRKRLRAAGKLKKSGISAGYHGRREFATAAELEEREQLRRERLSEDAA